MVLNPRGGYAVFPKMITSSAQIKTSDLVNMKTTKKK